jgi:hypothetical protein
MSAAVDHRMNLAVPISRNDDRCFADGRRPIIAGVLDLDVEAQEIPGLAPENLLLLELVDFRIRKELIGRASHALWWPGNFCEFRSYCVT